MDRRAVIAVLLLLSIAGLVALPVEGLRPDGAEIGTVRVCPAAPDERVPPDFANPACRILPVNQAELCFVQGGQTLHSMSLNELGEALPASFLRVHPSHIVNVAFVKSLTRLASGVGHLELTNGATVPVSRRIMPMLRRALDQVPDHKGQ